MEFVRRVSLGDILAAMACVLSVGAGWATLSAEQTAANKRIERNEAAITKVDERMRTAEAAQAGQSSTLAAILQQVQDINARLARMEDRR